MISKITFLVQSGKYEFFELILQCYILETLSLSQYLNFKWIGIHPTAVKICAEFNLNPKIYFFLLVLAAVAPLSVNIIASASTTPVTISSASCHPSRNPLFRKKQVTPVIFLSEGDGTYSTLPIDSRIIGKIAILPIFRIQSTEFNHDHQSSTFISSIRLDSLYVVL